MINYTDLRGLSESVESERHTSYGLSRICKSDITNFRIKQATNFSASENLSRQLGGINFCAVASALPSKLERIAHSQP